MRAQHTFMSLFELLSTEEGSEHPMDNTVVSIKPPEKSLMHHGNIV